MLVKIPYNKSQIDIMVPNDATVYRTSYKDSGIDTREVVLSAVRNPVKSIPLLEKIKKSGAKSVVIVVSDITRPIPYAEFLDKDVTFWGLSPG